MLAPLARGILKTLGTRRAWVAHIRGRVRARNLLSKHDGARLFHNHNGRLLEMAQGALPAALESSSLMHSVLDSRFKCPKA